MPTDVVAANYTLAIAIDVFAALLYASGLILQRYSLSTPEASPGRVAVFGVLVRRNVGWGLGMFTYAMANAAYTVAMQYAPVSLLTTVFAVALVMNAVFGQLVLGEVVDRPGVAGYAVLILGIGISAVGLPKGNHAVSGRGRGSERSTSLVKTAWRVVCESRAPERLGAQPLSETRS
eukprot:SAG22_NODE_6719_length_820_cov_0.914008_2_plen_177_part_00